MGRFRLRPLCAADANWIAREIANPEVHRWLTSVPSPYGLGDALDFIDRFSGNPGFRTIEIGGQPLGVISIESAASFEANRSKRPELGYWLAQAAWGRGMMTDAGQQMVDWFFETGQGSVIGSGWIDGNARSRAVLSKLGFTATGERVMRHSFFHGKEMPVLRVSLTKEQWQNTKPA